MEQQIVVNAGVRETRVALLEDGKLAELKIDRHESSVGNVYEGKVENVVPGLDAAFVNIGLDRNAFLHVADAMEEEPPLRARRSNDLPPIGKVVRPGQELLVQVTKGPIRRKGGRVTSRISLPGRYCVLMAQGGKKVGVSRKIEDPKERDRLRKMAEKLRPKDFGLIVRTRAEGCSSAELSRDVRFLRRVWRGVQDRAAKAKAPALVYEDVGPVYSVIRDVFSEDVSELVVDDEDAYKRIVSLVQATAPKLRPRIRLYERDEPIFDAYGVNAEIERALRPRVWMENGGSIVIEETEALTVIDVNTGKFTGTKRLAQTVLQTNLDAVEEVARQLRLRDIGGIVVVDFIDMDNRKHRREVMNALRQRLRRDRMKTRIVHLTPLGLVEMTRKRTGDSLAGKMTASCQHCEGRGYVLSPQSVARQAESQLRKMAEKTKAEAFLVTASPQVALALVGEGGGDADRLEQHLGRAVYVRADERMHPERFDIEPGKRRAIQRKHLPYKAGRVIEIQPRDVLTEPPRPPVALVKGYIVQLPDDLPPVSDPCRVRLDEVHHSYALASPVPAQSGKSRRRK
ncbi:MAG: ribonuclease E/G [Armatimonadota bacterium]